MEINLTIDGEDIPMNNFVEKIIAGVVAGAAESLNDVEKDWKNLQLIIKR
jgi:hypothetical protein